jgi:hypothetical protein
LIFPPNPSVDKDDWLFLPVFNGVANADYELTVVNNVFKYPVTGSQSFDLVVLDLPSSGATTQTVIGSYAGITQAGVVYQTYYQMHIQVVQLTHLLPMATFILLFMQHHHKLPVPL